MRPVDPAGRQLWMPKEWDQWVVTEPPRGLIIAMGRREMFEYGINVYDDGRAIFQSVRCPLDRAIKEKRLDPKTIVALRRAVDGVSKEYWSVGYVSLHAPYYVLAYVGQNQRVAVFGGSGTPEALVDVADLIDRTVGSGDWIP
jgi:hypothetical protein